MRFLWVDQARLKIVDTKAIVTRILRLIERSQNAMRRSVSDCGPRKKKVWITIFRSFQWCAITATRLRCHLSLFVHLFVGTTLLHTLKAKNIAKSDRQLRGCEQGDSSTDVKVKERKTRSRKKQTTKKEQDFLNELDTLFDVAIGNKFQVIF